MAAVIGNNGIYNRNPNAVPRGYAGGDYIFLADDSNGAVTSRSQNFWDNGVWTASVTSAVAANTARTIVNISGKSGKQYWVGGRYFCNHSRRRGNIAFLPCNIAKYKSKSFFWGNRNRWRHHFLYTGGCGWKQWNRYME